MFKEIKFALYAIKKNIQSSAELRTSFMMNIVGMMINNSAFIILWVFFVKSVGVIGGWTAADIIGLQGFAALSYGVIFSVAVGIRKLPDYVASGSFDRFMLSPKNLLMRVATSAFNASSAGDVIFGAICIIVYGFLIHATTVQVLFAIALIILAVMVFFAIALIANSVSFFITDASGVVTGGLFELFLTPSLFHGGAFQGVMRFIFTFIIPALLIGAVPVEAIKNISVHQLIVTTVMAFVWLFISIKFFYKAVKRYESSNFMTFGV
ncbi:MAG: ABC-2 family transporter protein [bacterium]